MSRRSAPPALDGEPLIDLRPHCDRAPYVVSELLPMHRVFRLFQTMGLRHLPVINEHSQVVGMITRKDLLHLDERSLRLLANKRRADTWKRHEEKGREEVRTSRHGPGSNSWHGGTSWLGGSPEAGNGGGVSTAEVRVQMVAAP